MRKDAVTQCKADTLLDRSMLAVCDEQMYDEVAPIALLVNASAVYTATVSLVSSKHVTLYQFRNWVNRRRNDKRTIADARELLLGRHE